MSAGRRARRSSRRRQEPQDLLPGDTRATAYYGPTNTISFPTRRHVRHNALPPWPRTAPTAHRVTASTSRRAGPSPAGCGCFIHEGSRPFYSKGQDMTYSSSARTCLARRSAHRAGASGSTRHTRRRHAPRIGAIVSAPTPLATCCVTLAALAISCKLQKEPTPTLLPPTLLKLVRWPLLGASLRPYADCVPILHSPTELRRATPLLPSAVAAAATFPRLFRRCAPHTSCRARADVTPLGWRVEEASARPCAHHVGASAPPRASSRHLPLPWRPDCLALPCLALP